MLAHFSDAKENRHKQIVSRTIWITAIASLVFGTLNIDMNSWLSALVICISGGVCLAALLVNQKNHQTLASLMVCFSVLVALTYSIYDGDGLLDPGIVGYPLFILIGTLLLDKRFTLWLTLAALTSLGFIGIMQAQGLLHLTIHPESAANLLPISIFLVTGALVVWVILDNMQKNFEQVRTSEIELSLSYDLTLQGWSRALDMRDDGTGVHSHRVVELAEKLARALNMDKKELLFFRYGAFLHDIGKIGIPDSILLKDGPLSPEEWDIMRSHPLKAQELLAGIPYLKPALDIPLYHHERWDGGGYPYHLKETAIPFAARIFAVVDVWDALTSTRPYRPAWTREKALAYIVEQSGQHFDPEVVKVFLKIIEQTGPAN